MLGGCSGKYGTGMWCGTWWGEARGRSCKEGSAADTMGQPTTRQGRVTVSNLAKMTTAANCNTVAGLWLSYCGEKGGLPVGIWKIWSPDPESRSQAVPVEKTNFPNLQITTIAEKLNCTYEA